MEFDGFGCPFCLQIDPLHGLLRKGGCHSHDHENIFAIMMQVSRGQQFILATRPPRPRLVRA